MSEQLKSCPFCGSHNISVISCTQEREYKSACKDVQFSYYVECDYCRVRTDSYVTRQDAVNAWETRSWQEKH
ncbi:MAG: Lar family restriction alleviation protein [Synergistaceae bacterium]|nr:Lar family restriction alleviation protein [Synergistaceae bacterium]